MAASPERSPALARLSSPGSAPRRSRCAGSRPSSASARTGATRSAACRRAATGSSSPRAAGPRATRRNGGKTPRRRRRRSRSRCPQGPRPRASSRSSSGASPALSCQVGQCRENAPGSDCMHRVPRCLCLRPSRAAVGGRGAHRAGEFHEAARSGCRRDGHGNRARSGGRGDCAAALGRAEPGPRAGHAATHQPHGRAPGHRRRQGSVWPPGQRRVRAGRQRDRPGKDRANRIRRAVPASAAADRRVHDQLPDLPAGARGDRAGPPAGTSWSGPARSPACLR